jgi:hypothetical protein
MALKTRHSGFQGINWAGITIEKCTVVDWGTNMAGTWDLTDDDSVNRTGIIPFGSAGEITITGRNIGGLALTYQGRSATMVVTLLDADSDLGITGDILTLKQCTLLGIDQNVPTHGIGEKNLKFAFSSGTVNDKELYTVA